MYLFDLLQELLNQCENWRVLFNNRTTDSTKKDEQVQELISIVNLVVEKSGGRPYTDELFVELKVTFSCWYCMLLLCKRLLKFGPLLQKGARMLHDQIEVFKQENEEKLIKRSTEWYLLFLSTLFPTVVTFAYIILYGAQCSQ